MVHELHMDFEWVSPEGARGPELRATWARLCISVGDEHVTRVEDLASHGTRGGVYGPLYPVAEWIVGNWWFLLHEVASPDKDSSKEYTRRHNLAAAAEGFSLPSLVIKPEGERTLLVWSRRLLPRHGIQFINENKATVDTNQLESELRSFIQAVVTRLEDEGVQGTLLAEEWLAINDADAEERAYCAALGRLGLDPYAPETEATGHAVINLAELLPPHVFDEFMHTADPLELEAQGASLTRFLTEAGALELDLPALRRLKEETKTLAAHASGQTLPWDQGYVFAQGLRAFLNGSATPPVSTVANLGKLLSAPPDAWASAVSATNGMSSFLKAAVGAMRTQSPYFAVAPVRNETGRVFLLCRALYEYLTTPEPSAAVVTNANSEQQKRNRAFAAEFLAPAAQLRDNIHKNVVSNDDITDLAALFGTSEYVIRHQIWNHNLATISTGEYY